MFTVVIPYQVRSYQTKFVTGRKAAGGSLEVVIPYQVRSYQTLLNCAAKACPYLHVVIPYQVRSYQTGCSQGRYMT